MSIYTNQRIPLSTLFTDDDGVVNLAGATIRYDYWAPGNAPPNDKSGSVVGVIEDEVTGEASGSIPDTVNIVAGNWVVQGNATIGSDEWPEVSKKYKVLDRGKI